MVETVPDHATAQDDRVRRFQAKTAGILALTGAVLMITSSLLQQRSEIPRGEPLAVLEHIDGTPWFAAALAGVLAVLCWGIAFATVGRILQSPVSRAVARMAQPVLTVAVAVFAVNYAHDGLSSGVIAQEWAAGARNDAAAQVDSRIVEELVGGTSILSQTLLGLALALYAWAMLRSRQYSRVLCWVGVVGSLGWFIGGAVLFLQLPGASFELVLPFTTLTTIWVVGVGVALLRRRSRDPQAQPSEPNG